MVVERELWGRECEESIYTYTERGHRQGRRETWERECERGITLQYMHMTSNAHDLKSRLRERERDDDELGIKTRRRDMKRNKCRRVMVSRSVQGKNKT